ncbi:cytochrome P450 [Aspergillus flavus]|uniref:Cytochrome P450 n=1 Tax=Aspergillus flavus TaxID=5059 RepID=A0AB74CRC6_ASPFL|nr:cytochrome P450 [Aspergillus flavus]
MTQTAHNGQERLPPTLLTGQEPDRVLLAHCRSVAHDYRRGKKLHEDLVETYGGIIKDTEREMKEGKKVVLDCLAKTMVEMRDKEDLDDPDMAILASTFMIGGAETTAAIMQWFSALIPVYPEIQNQPRKNSILLLDVTISLVERVHNSFWLGTPHVASEDCVYREKYIPKETVVVLNTWTMHYDPTRHSNPETFDPDRYINDPLTSAESANVANPMERDHWMFGAGRRICPGMLVAGREIWLSISRMLWAFDMYEIPDEPIDLK